MSLSQMFLAEFKAEAASTRKILEACPADKFGWKPHEKSMTLGRLAGHIAEIPGWAGWMVRPTLDMAGLGSDYVPFEPTTAEELVSHFDEQVKVFVDTVTPLTDEQLQQDWAMTQGEQVMMKMPRAAAFRGWLFSHAFHHRGQLSVYLRLLDVALPQIYGPTADQPDFG